MRTALDADLSCSTETALTIAADGVKLDLGGRRVSSFGGVGVLNDGHDGVAIRNGSILAPSGSPIVLSHADDNRLEDLQASGGGGPAVLLDDPTTAASSAALSVRSWAAWV
ncbi:MAG: hypothetical protein ABI726_02115 [bacterium]